MTQLAPVSVVVPCYRCEASIERAVASVAVQTQRPTELILVDDASGDGTWKALHSIRAKYGDWVKIVALPVNVGAGTARNVGWDLATQPYLAFLDADDAWHPEKIAIQYAYMSAHPEIALSGHLCRQLPSGEVQAPHWKAELRGVQKMTWNRLLLRHAFVTPSAMLKRAIEPRFAAGVSHMEDHRLWLEIVGASLPTVKLQVELVAVYKPVYGSSGLSADMWSMEQGELANYQYFFGRGQISLLRCMLLQCYSLLKFVRRLIVVRFQRHS